MIGRVVQWNSGTRLTTIFLIYNLFIICVISSLDVCNGLVLHPFRGLSETCDFKIILKVLKFEFISLRNQGDSNYQIRRISVWINQAAQTIGPGRGVVWADLSVLWNVSVPPVRVSDMLKHHRDQLCYCQGYISFSCKIVCLEGFGSYQIWAQVYFKRVTKLLPKSILYRIHSRLFYFGLTVILLCSLLWQVELIEL